MYRYVTDKDDLRKVKGDGLIVVIERKVRHRPSLGQCRLSYLQSMSLRPTLVLSSCQLCRIVKRPYYKTVVRLN
jgi:hypothetical protein